MAGSLLEFPLFEKCPRANSAFFFVICSKRRCETFTKCECGKNPNKSEINLEWGCMPLVAMLKVRYSVVP